MGWSEAPPAIARAEFLWTRRAGRARRDPPGRERRDERAGAALARFCAGDGPHRHGTSIWVEDVVGHVGVPDELRWIKTNPLTLVADHEVTVRESDCEVDAGVVLEPGDDFALEAGGSIHSGVLFTGANGPQGWDNVDHDPKFPLHEGPDAHPFALIGRIGDEPWFYVGSSRSRAGYDGPPQRLLLRTNDDSPGNGSGAFTCRVRVWRALPRSAAFAG